jgi:hypothetical protein
MHTTQHPGSKWRPRRYIHLVDAENVAATSEPSRRRLARTRRILEAAVDVGPDDHLVVGADRHVALEVGLVWPGAQLLVGHGRGGALRALLGWARDADIAGRFDGAVIASGDCALPGLAASLRAAEVPVTVAAWRASCSRRLAAIATTLRWLDPAPVLAAGFEVPRAA